MELETKDFDQGLRLDLECEVFFMSQFAFSKTGSVGHG